MRPLSSLLLALVLLPVQPPSGDGPKKLVCKGHPELVGKCFTIHGRLNATNGNPGVRIWRIGTKRILGVSDRGREVGIMPEDLEEKFIPFKNKIYGDFEVCPFTKEKPGVMQLVCIESASKLVVKKYPALPSK